jgi:hypothetical protein
MTEFFASLYELGDMFYFDTFSNDMYDYDIYMTIGWFLIASSLVMMFVYYIVIDHPKFSRWFHWALWILILATINFGFAYYWSSTELGFIYEDIGTEVPYSNEFTNFSIVNAIWSIVFGFIFSIALKWRAVSARRTPF